MTVAAEKLKAPFPYFGGKSKCAPLVWSRLGNVRNYIEPFFGSGAMLLLRPHAPQIETVNDADCHVANFWRAVQQAPELVAYWANWPVNEADLHARHRWLVGISSDKAMRAAVTFAERMKRDPDFYDVKRAGWWVWGMCQWIGGGWCTPHGRTLDDGIKQPTPDTSPESYGRGVHRKRPNIGRDHGGMLGVHSKGEKLPRLNGGRRGDESYGGLGVHADATGAPANWNQRPNLQSDQGVNSGRPQLADAFSRGRGVHSNDSIEVCEAREEWLAQWMKRLRDRLRPVRVCCGDWSRVCSSRSTTTRIGMTGVFLDPPYAAETGRDMNLYAKECGKVAHEVRAWCIEQGVNPQMRIALAGLAGEHDELEQHGWEVVAWTAHGGYGNRNKDNDNKNRERIWFSPHCVRGGSLFEQQEAAR